MTVTNPCGGNFGSDTTGAGVCVGGWGNTVSASEEGAVNRFRLGGGDAPAGDNDGVSRALAVRADSALVMSADNQTRIMPRVRENRVLGDFACLRRRWAVQIPEATYAWLVDVLRRGRW